MSISIKVMKSANGVLVPVTEHDADLIKKMRVGQGYDVMMVQQSERAMKHHRLMYAGLLPLTLEYWEPVGGMLSISEINLVHYIAKRVDKKLPGAKTEMGLILRHVARERAKQAPTHNKTINQLMDWLKLEVGHVRILHTPRGRYEIPMSINFNSMKQPEFEEFYKKVFDVCWRVCLKEVFKGDAEECDKVINQLLAMG